MQEKREEVAPLRLHPACEARLAMGGEGECGVGQVEGKVVVALETWHEDGEVYCPTALAPLEERAPRRRRRGRHHRAEPKAPLGREANGVPLKETLSSVQCSPQPTIVDCEKSNIAQSYH
eukprot:scaffold53834_cov32-Tisochrysis_lutea.AAC.1